MSYITGHDFTARASSVLALAALAVTAACSSSNGDSSAATADEAAAKTGLSLTIDMLGDTDVKGFEFTIAQATSGRCQLQPGPQGQGQTQAQQKTSLGKSFQTIVVQKPLEDLILRESRRSTAQTQGSEGRHVFADYFTMLPAGCYDIKARPLAEGARTSSDCSEAQAKDVVIQESQVKEIWLMSQCRTEQMGSLDTAVVVNHQPKIVRVEYTPSKFVQACQATQVCVNVEDADGDAIRLSIEQTAGGKLYEALQKDVTLERSQGKGFASGGQTCFRLVAQEPGEYEFAIKAYDLEADGQTTHEQALAQSGSQAQSHSMLQGLPFRVGYQPDSLCWDGNAAVPIEGTQAVERVQGCLVRTNEEYFCSALEGQKAGFDTQRTCPSGRFEPKEAFPACSARRTEQGGTKVVGQAP